MDTNVRVDRTMFLTTVLVILFVAIPIIGFNEQSGLFITQLYNKITTNFGFVYQWYTIGIFGFLVWLASSCLLYTSPSPRDRQKSRMPSSA